MDELAQTLPKKILPNRIRRELKKGETIYHSAIPCHVSAKHPEGKWIAQVRREDKVKLIKYPVKGFGTPKEALDYIITLRPNERGQVAVVNRGEPTVADLYEYARAHRQKRLGESTKADKESRWRNHIGPEWATMPLSRVTRRAAQEWVTRMEALIEDGKAGTLGIGQFEKVRTDLHSLFESLPSFSSDYEDCRNPFADLIFIERQQRVKVTVESQHFAAIENACEVFASNGFCTPWIAEMFLTSLFAGLRRGEAMALCRDQIDLKNKAIVVDRALRRHSRAIDPKTRLEVGPVLRQAMNLPKGGSATINKTRVVPISNQLVRILQRANDRSGSPESEWDLLWPCESGILREVERFRAAWSTLRQRLHELATLAPIDHEEGQPWPEREKRRGWERNPLVERAQEYPSLRVPNIFEDMDYRDTRNSFGSFLNEAGISQATREHTLGHGGGLTNTVYTVVTSRTFKDMQRRLSRGWKSSVT